LEEIADLPLSAQATLLRALETGEVKPLGSDVAVPFEARVIAATRHDVEQLVRSRKFGEGLYYRLNVLRISLPPLRERPDDIPLLVQNLLERHAHELQRRTPELTHAALQALCAHPWPGNVRELANAVERALVVGTPPSVRAEDLPAGIGREAGREAAGESLEEVERGHVRTILERKEWNITHAARALGIDRATLYNKIKKYGLRNPDQAE
jgi:DNA-binding NtrC family response regulator